MPYGVVSTYGTGALAGRPRNWVRVAHCQSTGRPAADMALREHLREAAMKVLGKQSARIGHRGADYI